MRAFIADQIAWPFYLWKWLRRHHSVRKIVTFLILGFTAASTVLGVGIALALVLLVIQFGVQIGMMIGQFALLMLFLGSSKTIDVIPGDKHEVTFDNDYYGNENEVRLVRQWVKLLTTGREDFEALGGKAVSGILLTGPPGVGKTLMARALAGDSHAGFLGMSGADFMSMWFGMGAFKVLTTGAKAKDYSRRYGACIWFIDEIDSIAASRGGVQGGGAMNPMVGMMGGGGLGVLTRLLTFMDGLREGDIRTDLRNLWRRRLGARLIPRSNVLVMAATNRPDVLDPAIMRPGRFDQIIPIGLPDKATRRALFKGYLAKVPHSLTDDDVDNLVNDTQGVAHVAIAAAVEKDALRICVFGGRKVVEVGDVIHGLEERVLGLANPIVDWDPEQRESVAYHEAGHLVAAWKLRPRKRIARTSIIRRSRGMLGYMMDVETKEIYGRPMEDYAADVMVSLAGHVAVRIWCGKEWTGATSDFQHVRQIMYTMAGLAQFDRQIPFRLDDPFTNEDIKKAADRYLKRSEAGTERLLRSNWRAVEVIASALLEKDELNSTEIAAILGGV